MACAWRPTRICGAHGVGRAAPCGLLGDQTPFSRTRRHWSAIVRRPESRRKWTPMRRACVRTMSQDELTFFESKRLSGNAGPPVGRGWIEAALAELGEPRAELGGVEA